MNNQIRFGFSLKKDGPMGVLRANEPQHISNRRKFASQSLGINPSKMITANPTQGCKAVIVSEKNIGKIIPDSDALITQIPDIGLRIFTQDCVPVFIHDLEETTIGIIHAGWRGIKGGIIENAASQIEKLGINAQNLKFFTGPSISQCCYEIDGEVADYFLANHPKCTAKNNEKIHLSLQKTIEEKLTLFGVLPSNIFTDPNCTFCSKDYFGHKYFSWRRDRQVSATHASIITIFPRSQLQTGLLRI